MIVSRGAALLRGLNHVRKSTQMVQAVRHGHHWNYRVSPPPPPKDVLIAAEVVCAFAWWWVLWHLWTEPGHVFGEFEYPDASKWTDEELGIPSS